MPRASVPIVAIIAALAAIPMTASAQVPSSSGARAPSVSCTAPARAAFEQGLVLLHHMTYPEAREAFGRAARIDSRCAMAHWGVAMSLFQPLWPTRPGPEELRRGREAVADALAQNPGPRERSLIAA